MKKANGSGSTVMEPSPAEAGPGGRVAKRGLGIILLGLFLVMALMTGCMEDTYEPDYDYESDEETLLVPTSSEDDYSTSPMSSGGTYAVIYNGPVAAEGGPEAVASIAEDVGLPVMYIADVGELPDMLDDTAVFIIGGTEDDLDPLRDAFTPDVMEALQDYLRQGGRYWGICGGGYLASTGWEDEGRFVGMLALVPAVSYEFDENDEPQILSIEWFDETELMYFQFGPGFELEPTEEEVNVFAYYSDGGIAGLMSSYGHGKVAVSGPHPEALEDWGYEIDDVGDWSADPSLGERLLRALLSNDPVTP